MRFTTLNGWLTWQETLHPQEIDLGLERIAAVWRRLALDLGGAKVVTIAGTNGKGSCVAMLESIYLAAGYRTGAYTSPHLLHYNERIRINGQPVSDESLCLAFECVDQARGDASLSYFEFGTLAALVLFAGPVTSEPNAAQQPLDVVLLEVGLGGRLDAVNIIAADVALISSIAIDHSDWLGADRDSIGFEKAGIFRQGQAAVCGDPEPPASVLEQARLRGTELYCLGRDFQMLTDSPNAGCWSWFGYPGFGQPESGQPERYDALPLPRLEGAVQLNNAASVLQVLALLEDRLPVAVDAIRQGLRQVQLPGRYQRLYCRVPLQSCAADDEGAVAIIADVAHNPAAATVLAQTLRDNQSHCGKTRAVIGMLADKDVTAVLAALNDVVDYWYVTEPAVTRACPVAELLAALETIRASGDRSSVMACTNVRQAMQQALLDARAVSPGSGSGSDLSIDAADRILVVGSFYTVAEFLAAVSS